MTTTIRTVGVVGTGVIGASWTGLFLAKGLRVLVADPAPHAKEQLQGNLDSIWPTLQKLGLSARASKDNWEFVGASIKSRGNDLDFVQENGPERPELKSSIIAEIDQSTRSDIVIASSSSGIPSSNFVGGCSHPDRVLIGHPFNPPHLMPLVEVVPHPETNSAIIQQALQFYESIGKKPVLVKQETPGFAANRLQAALCNEAYSLVNRGILSAEDLDACVTTSLGPRWTVTGPFMSNVLGGGAGGFKHLLTHLGPASKVWTEDMKANEFDHSAEAIERLDRSVQEMLKKHPVEIVAKERDDVTIDILKLKQETETLI